MDTIKLTINGRLHEVRGVPATLTLLQYLRDHAGLAGCKEGCAEGDCGACTVAVLDGGWRAEDACLIPLASLDGVTVATVEGLGDERAPHPVQRSLTRHLGSQCGYCTPGIVMSLFEACHRRDLDAAWKIDDQLCGNLCRCTGYRPIREAAEEVAGSAPADGLGAQVSAPLRAFHYKGPEGWFAAPDSLAEATRLLAQHPEATLIAGATDLGLDITQRHRLFPGLLSVGRIPELRQIEEHASGWRVGAAVPLTDVESWADLNLVPLARMLRFFGSRQIKHRATLGGNLGNASPIGDTPPILMALDATVLLASVSGVRRVPVAEFFAGYRQTLRRPDEIIAGVDIPRPDPAARIGACKVSKRREMDISAVAAGLYVRVAGGVVAEARLAFGGMAATPARARGAEAALVGQPWVEGAVRAAMAALDTDFQPLSDHRGSAWYRATVARNLLWGFFEETASAPVVRLPDRPSATLVLPGGAA